MASPSKLPGPALTIKAEPGTSRSPSLRLPSFKPPRDMMLGGPLPNVDVRSSRKVYVPNLNVQRKKNQEETAVKADSGAGRGSPNLRGARGRGDRGKKKLPDLVQSAGSVFSEGLAKEVRPKRESKYGEGGGVGGGGGGRGGGRGSGGRFLKSSSRIDEIDNFSTEADSYGKLAHLLQDCDFIDDPGICPDEDNQPRELMSLHLTTEPLITKGMVKGGADVVGNGVKVKKEELDVLTATEKTEIEDVITFPKLFRAASPKLILMKLPPGLVTPDSVPNDVSRPSTSVAAPEATLEKNPTEGCCLPEGRIGTMQLMKSGEVRLLVGDHVFVAELGTRTSMKQDVMVLNVDPNGTGGDSINLGPIDAHFVSSRVTLDSPCFNARIAGAKIET